MFQIQQLRDVSVDMIEPNLSQPRRRFDEGTLQELAGSIGERGVLQPVLVRPGTDGSYELIAGERRWRAAKLAGLETIPALVSSHDDAAALQIALIENMVRADLNPVEEARAFATLSQEFGLSHRQIAIRVGRNISVVSNTIRLLQLSEEILELVERGQLSFESRTRAADGKGSRGAWSAGSCGGGGGVGSTGARRSNPCKQRGSARVPAGSR